MVKLSDSRTFRRNEHHITRRQDAKQAILPQLPLNEVKSYNLRPRKNTKHVHWPDMPTEAIQGTKEFELPVDF